MKKITKFQDFKWALFIEKIKFLNWWMYKKENLLRSAFCRREWHYFKRDSIIYTKKSPGKKEVRRETHFIKCLVCGVLYFPTEKDKRNWQFIEKAKHKNMKLLIDDLNKKQKLKEINKGKVE